jgi:threonine dehydrogenase-like Zn-dependent dehydrogenase
MAPKEAAAVARLTSHAHRASSGDVRAAITTGDRLEIRDVEDPEPGPGQVLVRSVACGICGSDLHALRHMSRFADLVRRSGASSTLQPGSEVIFGHEMCAEVLDYGPGSEHPLPIGSLVCSIPILLGERGPEPLGYSDRFPGGLAERMLLQEMFLLPVPEGLDAVQASLTEPLAVGEHAVAVSDAGPGDICMVIGCGPVGLAVIAALKARGLGPVIAADFSSRRRQLAEVVGADEVVDPAATSPHSRWSDLGVPRTMPERIGAEMLGVPANDAVVFEAVGVPGILQGIIDEAPPRSRVVVVGVCMETDAIEPFVAVTKELELRFVFGYSAAEFAATLARLESGAVPTDELVTSVVALDDVADAFEALARPDEHGKIVVRP